jgi:TPP-dependent pyruvate/acetoin dehydrogenase alpha subunit
VHITEHNDVYELREGSAFGMPGVLVDGMDVRKVGEFYWEYDIM